MDTSVQQIKDRLDIVELVKEYFPLKQAGSNFKAPCPFHKEKSPSFMVSASKQIWHCFGCGEGGDIFTFFTKIEGLEFKEALQILAKRTGVTLQTSFTGQPKDKKERLYELMGLASDYFCQAISRAPQGQEAREYLTDRGITIDIQDEFSFGYALQDFDRLYQYLISKKYTTPEIIDVGLVVVKERGRAMDRFRDRIMIPIRDINGHTVGFGGRILHEKENAPKYLNSPQTTLYDKSRVVFNLDRARHAIRQDDQAIIVEGYMDVIGLVQGGVRNVVASCGTALTVDQIKLIKRFTQRFLFCFDSDAAGVQATERGVDIALKEGIDAQIIQLPRDTDGNALYKDPDECIRKDPEGWGVSVKNAMPFIEFLTKNELRNNVLRDPHTKTQSAHKILAFINRIPDRIMQDHWVTYLAQQMSISETILWEELDTAKKRLRMPFRPATVSPASGSVTKSRSRIDSLEFSFIVSLLQSPESIGTASGLVRSDMVLDTDISALYNLLCSDYSDSTSLPSFGTLVASLSFDADLAQRIDAAVAFEESEPGKTEGLCARIRSRYREHRLQELQTLMANAEREHDGKSVSQYMEEFQKIQKM
ncbi:MAG: DNA primase [bacterium]|nr:DNA primase [bacterium]